MKLSQRLMVSGTCSTANFQHSWTIVSMAIVMVRVSQTIRRRRSRVLFEIMGWFIANRYPYDRQRAQRLDLKYGHQMETSWKNQTIGARTPSSERIFARYVID